MSKVGSDDFVEDAIDSLMADTELGFVLIAAHFESENTHKACNIPSLAHLEWMRQRWEEFYQEHTQRLQE